MRFYYFLIICSLIKAGDLPELPLPEFNTFTEILEQALVQNPCLLRNLNRKIKNETLGKYVCKLCKKSMSYENKNRHEKSNLHQLNLPTNQRLSPCYRCNSCRINYNRTDHWRSHLKKIHHIENCAPYVCICKKNFLDKNDLIHHIEMTNHKPL